MGGVKARGAPGQRELVAEGVGRYLAGAAPVAAAVEEPYVDG